MSVGTISAVLDSRAPRPYKNGRSYIQHIKITTVGNYATGGVVLDLTGLNTPGLSSPYRSEFVSGAADPLGQTYIYNSGADRSLGKLMSFAGATEDADDSSWPDEFIYGTLWYNAEGLAV